MGTFTVEKAMLDARAAHLQESGLQRTTCAVQSDGHIVDRRVETFRDLVPRLFEQIGAPDDLRIVGFQCRQEPVKAIAHCLVKIHLRLRVRMAALGKLMRIDTDLLAAPSDDSPLEIGNRRCQNARKPTFDRFCLAKVSRAFDRPEHEALQNLVRFVGTVKTPVQEFENVLMTVHQRPSDGFVHRPQGIVAGSGRSGRIIIHRASNTNIPLRIAYLKLLQQSATLQEALIMFSRNRLLTIQAYRGRLKCR